MKRLVWLAMGAWLFPTVLFAQSPNIVLFVADDMTWSDCEPYGHPDVATPNLQRLADAGMCFDNMYTSTAMCAATRQQLYTGLYPARSGAYPNHSYVHEGVKSLGHYFKELGYNVVLVGKRHYGPAESFPFDFLGGREHDGGEGQDIDLEKIKPVIAGDKPFFLIITENQPHTPWNRGHPERYDKGSLTLPEYMVDDPRTRDEIVKYYAEITYADSLLGYTLDAIDAAQKTDHTIRIFTSEQGYQMPFGKWTCYDLGLKTGFIISWPGHITPQSRNSAFTQYVDVVPTLLDLVGKKPRKYDTGIKDAYGYTGFDGESFKDVVLGKKTTHRDYVFGIQTTRGIYYGSESYPIRAVRNDRFKYIQNYNFDSPFQNSPIHDKNNIYHEWLANEQVSPSVHDWLERYVTRPYEELYDIKNDPYERVNLATDPQYAATKATLRTALEAWMMQQGDLGVETEMKAQERIHH